MPNGLGIEHPIFLLASERSGGNLTRAIIGSHSRIAAPSPVHLLMYFDPLLPLYGDLSNDHNFRTLCEDASQFFAFQLSGSQQAPSADDLFGEAKERSLIGLLDVSFAYIMRAAGADHILFKENEAFRYADRLAAKYPNARFVYLVRDGRDVAASWIKSPVHMGTMTHIGETWRDEQRVCFSLLADPSLAPKMFVLHYEDLVGNTESTLRALCEFLGVSFEPDMLSFHQRSDIQEQSKGLRNWENLAKPIMGKNFNKYKEELGWWSIQTFNRIAHRELAALGYEVEEVLPAAVAGAKALKLSKEVFGLAKKMAKGRTLKASEVKIRATRRHNIDQIVSPREELQEPRWPRRFG
jgi:hypothetical protein